MDKMRLYDMRNALWGLGDEMLESKLVRDKRMGQLLTELGYLLASQIEEVDVQRPAPFDDGIKGAIRAGVKHAQTCKF